MTQDEVIKQITDLLSGDWKTLAFKIGAALLALVAWFFIRRMFGNAEIEAAKKATEEGHAQDQAGNSTNAGGIQGQINDTKKELDDMTKTVAAPAPLPKHTNDGDCKRCDLIFDAYPGFYAPLRAWFKGFQAQNPESHISCAGRGKEAQEKCFVAKTSKAHWKESSHNYNCALDLFENIPGDPKGIYDSEWFMSKVKPEMDLHPELNWYGRPDAEFKEVPHVEWRAWKILLASGQLKLVE